MIKVAILLVGQARFYKNNKSILDIISELGTDYTIIITPSCQTTKVSDRITH